MVSPNYPEQREWSDTFIPKIKRIVGPYLLSETPDEIDCTQAADLYVFTARDMRIAARVRKNKYLKWKHQFTIRSKLDSGHKTELEKIVDGWGDWMFYAILDGAEQEFAVWRLIDLHAFRAAMIRRNEFKLRTDEVPNGDGTYFRWFDLTSFPSHPPILVDTNDPLPFLQVRAA